MEDPGRNGSPPRRVFIILALAVLAVAGYVVYRWRSSGPLAAPQNRPHAVLPINTGQPTPIPTTGSPVPTTPSAAKSRFKLHAAFREAQRCMDERIIMRALAYNPDGARPSSHIPGCDDMKGALRQVYEATTAAAKAGDPDAQMCYLMQGGGDRESGFRLTDAEIAEYQALGPQYVDAAYKRGDWRIVELFGYDIVDWAGMFMSLEPWKDPLREYKSHRLLLLGAGDVNSQGTDSWLTVLRMPESNDTSRLSTQEMQESDAWAQTMYDKYFVSQTKLLKEPQVCTGEDEP
jgi:hypothetical protein